MNPLPSPFKNAKGEAAFMAAYEETMRLWSVPYKSMDIPSRFGRTHLVICGPKAAPPLVLLHCFFTSLTVWAYNMADLSRNYRVYALDMMGQPSKSIPDQPIGNRAEMAEWLTSVLDALEISQMDLAGYSYGGFAALNYAMYAPERIKKLILLSPAGGLASLKTQFYIRGMLCSIPGLTKLMTNSFLHWMFYAPNLRSEKSKQMLACMLNQMALGTSYFRMGTMVLPLACQDEELQRVKTPTLLLIGQQEALYDPVAAIARAQRLMPKIQAELIPQASHDLPVTRAETVNERVLGFLQERPTPITPPDDLAPVPTRLQSARIGA
jgi:pimeloyl-ACP methyl ester carboxylesterase